MKQIFKHQELEVGKKIVMIIKPGIDNNRVINNAFQIVREHKENEKTDFNKTFICEFLYANGPTKSKELVIYDLNFMMYDCYMYDKDEPLTTEHKIKIITGEKNETNL